MVKLSIIVPIYNVEKYLRKCVDSLLNQDIPSPEYEIILVDDGSTDGSGAICDSYVSIDDRCIDNRCTIKVIHRENGGLSAARNSGIEVANGEYVMFVDSDDYIEPNVVGGLLEKVKLEDLDVLRFDYQNVNEQYKVYLPYKYPHHVDREIGVVNGEEYLNRRMGYACYVTQFIIKREIVSQFTEGIHFEDVDWLPRMMLHAKRVNGTTKVVYNYLTRQGSITQTQGDKVKIKRNLEDRMAIIKKYKEYRSKHSSCLWLHNMQSSMVSGVLMTIAQEFYSEREEYIRRLIEQNVFPLAMADQGTTYKRRARIINAFGPRVYCFLMHWR